MRKKSLYLYFLLCIASCGINPANTDTTDVDNKQNDPFKASFHKWQEAKKAHNNSYEYTTTFRSYVGFGHTTIIEVQNGVVVKRTYYEFNRNYNLPTAIETILKYTEEKEALNTHQEGSPAITLDELYDNCAAVYLKADATKNRVTFRVDEAGIVSSCGYTPKNCADDCFKGIHITKIKWLD